LANQTRISDFFKGTKAGKWLSWNRVNPGQGKEMLLRITRAAFRQAKKNTSYGLRRGKKAD